ncbi:tRNA pseudouridine55 synthase [Desulfobotulus alkaliphilus]|uniref:tRNA pseudouridine synthase B n=1 Tax=Desulfobotulus alkaliphilus TaxID=622671 RepID=A0A562RCC1_9BACT|nr:tRNA pseudouridine(55) synthase TruB [Desulfobotulus alkaliphilus]TWI66046.1 tRNA pseudouridine55 synthase [Desulfobotulus alkaliphilus]
MHKDSILLIDKPPGLSSAAVVARVKKYSGIKKVGHAGTLDPFATGLLVVCLGKATRISRYFLGGNKSYEATLRLGTATETQDPEGAITATLPVPEVDEKKLLKVCEKFSGPILQSPPVYSALKHNGVPLYRLARQGKAVQKPPRQVVIHRLQPESIQLPDIRFSVHCSSGTYIRTLALDMAEALGSTGHLVALKRTETCGFSLAQAASLDDTLNSLQTSQPMPSLIPMAEALGFLPEIRVNNTLTEKIFHGKVLDTEEISAPVPGPIRVLTEDGRLAAVIRRDESRQGLFSYDAVLLPRTAPGGQL